jgi:hypothetical protein
VSVKGRAAQNKKSASFRAYGTDSITINGIDQQYWAASGRQSELAGHLCAQSWVDEVVLPIRVSLSGSLRASASRACAAALSLIHSLPVRFLTSNLKPPVVPSFAKVGTGLGNAEAGQEYFSKGLRREGRSPTQLLFAAVQCCIDRLIVILNVGFDMYRYNAF